MFSVENGPHADQRARNGRYLSVDTPPLKSADGFRVDWKMSTARRWSETTVEYAARELKQADACEDGQSRRICPLWKMDRSFR